MTKTRTTNRPGFTILELLVVMAILVALIALIMPAMMSRQTQANIRQATFQVDSLNNNLILYSNDNRGFPTTEQGLMALIYIPDNAGLGRSTMMSQQQPGQMGMDPMNGGFGTGEANMIGGDPMAMPVPGADGAMTPVMPNTTPGMPNTGTPTGMPNTGVDMTGATDPMLAMTDPMNPMGGAGGAMGGWTQPEYNPAIYAQLRKRPQPYVEKESDLIDPWGLPYRYENNLQYNGLNRTGTTKPAIWSAGPDKLDDTDDDIRNWDPIEAQQLMAARQQQMGNMSGGAMGNPMDPMNPGSMDPMQTDPMAPMTSGPMTPQPGAPQPPMTPQPIQPQPPMTPQPGAPQPPMTP